jgi:hypothetical protein
MRVGFWRRRLGGPKTDDQGSSMKHLGSCLEAA